MCLPTYLTWKGGDFVNYDDLRLSGVEIAERAEGMKPLYPVNSPYRPDLFTGDVLEAIVGRFGSVSEFCRLNDLSLSRFLRGLTPCGMEHEELSALAAKAVCDAFGLDAADFLNRMFDLTQ